MSGPAARGLSQCIHVPGLAVDRVGRYEIGEAAVVGRQVGAERARRLTLAVFYGVGSLLCFLTGLTSGWAASGRQAIVATALVTAAVTCWLLSRQTLTLFAARVLLISGSVLISGLTALAGGGEASLAYAMFTIWVVTYAFLFFPARTAWRQCTAALLSVTTALAVAYPWPAAAVNAAMVIGVVLTTGSVTNQLVRRLSRAADTDPLTGLLTENGLLGVRWRTTTAVRAILVLQVQNAASIKAAVGAGGRDELWQELAQRLSRSVDNTVMLARLSSDIFAAALTSADAVNARVETLREALQGVHRVQGLDIDISITAGISSQQDEPDDVPIAGLLTEAMQALTAAADEGRDVRLWTAELSSDAAAEISLGVDLRRGVAAGELVLLYQPQVNAHSAVMTGVEALVRWQHRDRGLLSPALFLPVAESGPLIVDLTYWVLDDAIRQGARWYHQGHELPISVNLSPRLLVHEGLVDDITQLLDRHGLPARLITLEVTETAVLTQPQRSREVLAQLRTIGAKISLDDFGTGYTSLAMLADLPLDEIKLDRQFVSRALDHVADAAIAQAVASLGRRMGLHVVAEGVEDEPTGRLIAEWGYDTIQGFLYSRPVTAAHVDQFLADRDRPTHPLAAPTIYDEADRSADARQFLTATVAADPVLRQVTTLAATALNASHAFVTLIHDDQQTFLATHGLDIDTMPRDQSFCTHAITTPNIMVVPDTTADSRFATHPVVTDQPNVRFYAGAPLITSNGHTIGTLCIFDTEPRTTTETQLNTLRTLADMTMHHLQQGLDNRRPLPITT